MKTIHDICKETSCRYEAFFHIYCIFICIGQYGRGLLGEKKKERITEKMIQLKKMWSLRMNSFSSSLVLIKKVSTMIARSSTFPGPLAIH